MANGGRFCASLLASLWHLLSVVSISWDGNSGMEMEIGKGFFYLPLMLREVLIVSIDRSTAAADNCQ